MSPAEQARATGAALIGARMADWYELVGREAQLGYELSPGEQTRKDELRALLGWGRRNGPR